MKYDVKIPTVGESITEATIGQWLKKSGEAVKRNDVLLLLETDKASVEVVAEQDGVLTYSAQAGQTVPIGSVVGNIDSEGKASVTSAAPVAAAKPAASSPQPAMSASANGSGTQIHSDLKSHLAPSVQKIVTEKGLDPANIQGTGRDGRLTKSDVANAQPAPSAPAKSPAVAPAKTFNGPSKQGDEKRVPMTTIRKKTADRLKAAQNTAAILTTFNEVDMSKANELRAKYKDKFKEKYGTSLGFMGIFVKAAIEALKDWPAVNASLDGNDIVYKNYYNIGVAVGTEKGLIVPTIKDADQLTVAGVELAIKTFAGKAREGRITIDDLSGGTFTISNGGVYGSLMSTPILNPPQSGILGMHNIVKRAVVVSEGGADKIEIRPMMYIALSYDHRIVDGKEAVTFLVKVKQAIEDPVRLLLGV
jgi:2-oxoglutarate dehydrogenase E2 component (dihydrolipoamide succinyltransferase)